MSTSVSNSLWDFSVRHYNRPRVAEACLQLQDSHGVNINVLLWSLWLESQGKALDEAKLAVALAAVAGWDNDYVQPLRQLRRQLKRDFADKLTQVAGLRQQIKGAELLAEQQEQLCLDALSREWASGETALAKGENLSFYLRYLRLPLERVSHALGECCAYL